MLRKITRQIKVEYRFAKSGAQPQKVVKATRAAKA